MAVRRRAGSARKMMAFSRIVNCHTVEEYANVFKKAGDNGLVLVEFVAGWSSSSKSMQPYQRIYTNTSCAHSRCIRIAYAHTGVERVT